MKVVLKFHCVCSIRGFAKFSGDPYYEPLAWFMTVTVTPISHTCYMYCPIKTGNRRNTKPHWTERVNSLMSSPR